MQHHPPSSQVPGCLYFEQTATGPVFPTLNQDLQVDVAVIGGGFTGLSTALHLREAGVDVAVFEARQPGWGASGRNGGQVNPGLKREPAEVLEMLGPERGERLIRLSGSAPDDVFDLIQRHSIDCDQARSGSIRVIRTQAEIPLIEESILTWGARGVDLGFLDRSALERHIGTAVYPAGLLDPRSGSINPLSYARGLASTVVRLGGQVFSHTPINGLQQIRGAWHLAAAGASIRSNTVVLATNGYTDGLWPGLKQTIIPVYSAIAATAPLSGSLRSRILPARQVVYESSWRVLYFRVDSQGHLLMGGPGVQRDMSPGGDNGHLIRIGQALFPDLAGVTWPYAWSGQVAVTGDHIPHLHEPARGIIAALGYNGRGIAMATVMGRLLCRRILGAAADELELPITPIQPLQFHRFWRPLVEVAAFRHGLLDRVRGLV